MCVTGYKDKRNEVTTTFKSKSSQEYINAFFNCQFQQKCLTYLFFQDYDLFCTGMSMQRTLSWNSTQDLRAESGVDTNLGLSLDAF